MVHEKIGRLKSNTEVRLRCACVARPQQVVQRHQRELAGSTVAAPVHVQIICHASAQHGQATSFTQSHRSSSATPAIPLYSPHILRRGRRITRQKTKQKRNKPRTHRSRFGHKPPSNASSPSSTCRCGSSTCATESRHHMSRDSRRCKSTSAAPRARSLHGALPQEHLLIGDIVEYDLQGKGVSEAIVAQNECGWRYIRRLAL